MCVKIELFFNETSIDVGVNHVQNGFEILISGKLKRTNKQTQHKSKLMNSFFFFKKTGAVFVTTWDNICYFSRVDGPR